ncbi:MAG: hypothetical protein LBJ32_02115 [Oscillospiraceae bacterium]|nr:hypothetical protein [Oscillospiraceae bacterium]
MVFIKNPNKLVSFVLSLVVSGTVCLGAMNLFCKDVSFYSGLNNVSVQKLDDNHAKLHCGSLKTENGDFLFSKTQTSDGFQYDISDVSGSEKFYGFSSKNDINFNNGKCCFSRNCAFCASIATGGLALGAFGPALATFMPLGTEEILALNNILQLKEWLLQLN